MSPDEGGLKLSQMMGWLGWMGGRQGIPGEKNHVSKDTVVGRSQDTGQWEIGPSGVDGRYQGKFKIRSMC